MRGDDRPGGDADDSGGSLDERVGRVLDAYLARLEAGRPADAAGLLADHPEIADRLREGLMMVDLAGRLSRHSTPPDLDSPAGSTFAEDPGGPTILRAGLEPAPRVLLRDAPGERGPLVLPPQGAPRPSTGAGSRRYHLLGEIARGGMGAVIKGRDNDLGRDLAIKVLLDRHRGNPDVLRRFVEEAQIGGQLQHPGIVPVYELGTLDDLRPFFAMKLVQGRTLSALLRERTDPSADFPRFLGIFEQVCQTMAYAHARGVIHRDLKPSNVMVGSFGEVQVMDWGLAKVIAEGGAADDDASGRPTREPAVSTLRSGSTGTESEAGSVMGTPAYMAPEQARGELDRVDERADVFGLGAILCEILTGKPPYSGSTPLEIRDRAARPDLGEAMARLGALASDPGWIALARDCLAADPDGRPRDAGVVARRVTGHLAGVQERLRASEMEQVQAETRAETERSRRRLAVVLAAAVVGLVVTLGGGGAWWAYDRQARASRVDVAVRGVEVLRGEAERAGDDPSKWSAAREAANHLGPLLAEARDAATRSRASALIESVNLATAAATADRAILDDLVAIRSGAVDEHPDQTEARYIEAFHARGIDPDAMSPADAGRAIAGRPSRVAVAMASALDIWAAGRRHRDRHAAERLDAVARLADPDPWRNRLRTAAGESDPSARQGALRRLARETTDTLPATSITLLAVLLLDSGEAAGAEAVLRPARDREPGDVWLNIYLAQSLKRLGRSEEAIRYFTAAQAAQPVTAHELAHALKDKGEADAAIDVFRDLTRRRPDEPRHFSCLGEALKSRGRAREGDDALDAAIAASRRRIRRNTDSAQAHHDLGYTLDARGDLDGAVAEYREAIRLKPDLAEAHGNLGVSLNARGDLDGAIAAFRQAIRLKPGLAEAHINLGSGLYYQGDLDGAAEALRQAIRLKPDHAGAHLNLGNVSHARGDFDGAVAEYREAIRLKPDDAVSYNRLGSILSDVKHEFDGAADAFRRAIRLKPDDARAHYNLGVALHAKGDFDGAIDAWNQARDRAASEPAILRMVQTRLAEAELAKRRAGRLPAVLRGDDRPTDAAERLAFAAMCLTRQLDAAAARLYADALETDPRLPDDRQAQHRYNAACAAARAGCGKGKDDPAPDEAAKRRLREQALGWLRAELSTWKKAAMTIEPGNKPPVAKALAHWKADADLAGVRDAADLTRLPEDERKAWQALWADVDALLNKVRS